MKARVSFLLPVFFLFITGGSICSAQIYKWVDEKGTVHFSDSPTAGNPPGKGQDKGRSPDRTPAKPQDRGQREALEKKQEKNQEKKQDGKEETQTAKQGSQPSLRHLEVGSRYIPEDMKKYGPAGGAEGPRGGGDASASSPRSSS
jgi:hypothetical protein